MIFVRQDGDHGSPIPAHGRPKMTAFCIPH
jgi:hypothetical protein